MVKFLQSSNLISIMGIIDIGIFWDYVSVLALK